MPAALATVVKVVLETRRRIVIIIGRSRNKRRQLRINRIHASRLWHSVHKETSRPIRANYTAATRVIMATMLISQKVLLSTAKGLSTNIIALMLEAV